MVTSVDEIDRKYDIWVEGWPIGRTGRSLGYAFIQGRGYSLTLIGIDRVASPEFVNCLLRQDVPVEPDVLGTP